MFLSARDPKTHAEALHHKVVDLDTGKDIPRVIWADDETGEYEQILVDEDGGIRINEQGDAVQSQIFNGNIKLVRVD